MFFKPLLKWCWIPRRDLPKTWVVFRYEKLQGLCFNCGIIGHEQNGCKRERAMVVVNKEVSRYSGQLGIPAARPISVIAKERGRWKTKPKYPAAGRGVWEDIRGRTSLGTQLNNSGRRNSSQLNVRVDKRSKRNKKWWLHR